MWPLKSQSEVPKVAPASPLRRHQNFLTFFFLIFTIFEKIYNESSLKKYKKSQSSEDTSKSVELFLYTYFPPRLYITFFFTKHLYSVLSLNKSVISVNVTTWILEMRTRLQQNICPQIVRCFWITMKGLKWILLDTLGLSNLI